MNSEWFDLAEGAKAFGVTLSAAQRAQFERYQALLLDWNSRMNLTAITDPAEIQIRHFLDALTCIRATGDLNEQRLIDVGTGAGFPGLPLKIVYPRLDLTLVDSVTKKTRFLQAVVAELGLANVEITAERAETLGQDPAYREQYDWAVARSVAEMRVLVEYLLPLCRLGGHMLAQKGESAESETAAAQAASPVLGGGTPSLHAIQLPRHPHTHYLVTIEKKRPTPPKYPRRPGRPAKKPL